MESNVKVSQAAGAVGSMTFLSRIFGFLRDTAIAMMFGSTAAADAFFVAFRIPNLQRGLLGEGAANAAFIPVFSEYLNAKSEREAWDLASNLFNVFSIILFVFALAIAIFAPAVIAVFAPGFLDEPEKFDLTVSLTRWMAPYLVLIGLTALCMGILNTFKVFALPAAAPVLMNLSMILAALLISPRLETPIIGLAVGVLLGGLLQLLTQLPAILRKGFTFSASLNWKHPGIAKIAKLLGPTTLGLAAYEINLMVDTILASLLPGGAISYLYYANRLVQLPLGVFGVAIGVAILPILSEQAARKELPELIKTLGFGIRLILFITAPATVGLIVLRFPIVNTLWERGEFLRSATEGTAFALLCYSVGLCAFAGTKVVVAAFYSLQDTKTPAKIGIYSMILNIALNLILMGPLKHGGIALATSIAAIFNSLALVVILKMRLGLMGGRKILRSAFQIAVAAAGMGLVAYGFDRAFFNPLAPLISKLLTLTVCIVSGLAAFYLISLLLKNEELIFLKDLLRRKFGKPGAEAPANRGSA
ncbi:MAG: murein biosynthesis integral membrane protein MurJ [Nitrospinae bacterium]|nr:murein biosynthesis integral membrane protein MurJ [Nitrospinota bacterium]